MTNLLSGLVGGKKKGIGGFTPVDMESSICVRYVVGKRLA